MIAEIIIIATITIVIGIGPNPIFCAPSMIRSIIPIRFRPSAKISPDMISVMMLANCFPIPPKKTSIILTESKACFGFLMTSRIMVRQTPIIIAVTTFILIEVITSSLNKSRSTSGNSGKSA